LTAALSPGALRASINPEIDLAMWVPEGMRPAALRELAVAGITARLNGRGTVVARIRADQKGQPVSALTSRGIPVIDFEVESH
jgi:hypothetical protein